MYSVYWANQATDTVNEGNYKIIIIIILFPAYVLSISASEFHTNYPTDQKQLVTVSIV